MAVLTLTSDQLSSTAKGYPNLMLVPPEWHGKERAAYWNVPALAALADIGSTIDLIKIPQGRVRFLPYAFRMINSAFGASRTLSIGLRAYSAVPGVVIAEDPNFFVTALDVSAAVTTPASPAPTIMKLDVYSIAGITVFAKIAGGTIPAAGTLSGLFKYLYD